MKRIRLRMSWGLLALVGGAVAGELPRMDVVLPRSAEEAQRFQESSGRSWVEGEWKMTNEEMTSDEEGARWQRIGVRVRGQSSVRWPQVSYAVEVRDERGEDKKVVVRPGWPAEADWVL